MNPIPSYRAYPNAADAGAGTRRLRWEEFSVALSLQSLLFLSLSLSDITFGRCFLLPAFELHLLLVQSFRVAQARAQTLSQRNGWVGDGRRTEHRDA